jgi:hypothetical protein
VNSPGFKAQFLNRWLWGEGERHGGWPEEWTTLPKLNDEEPPPELTAAIEIDLSASSYGVAFASVEGTTVKCWSFAFPTMEEAMAFLAKHQPHTVYAGRSIAGQIVGPFLVNSIGQRETGLATPLVAELARGRAIAHNHDPATAVQSNKARVSSGEHGPVLSAVKSLGPIPAVKAATWSIWGAVQVSQQETPAIF